MLRNRLDEGQPGDLYKKVAQGICKVIVGKEEFEDDVWMQVTVRKNDGTYMDEIHQEVIIDGGLVGSNCSDFQIKQPVVQADEVFEQVLDTYCEGYDGVESPGLANNIFQIVDTLYPQFEADDDFSTLLDEVDLNVITWTEDGN